MTRAVRDWAPVLDPRSGLTLPAQVAAAVRADVAAGTLRPGEPMPSSRTLAATLRISRGTVEAAYDQLLAEGYLQSRPRSGMLVHPRLRPGTPTAAGPPAGTPPEPPSPAPDALDLVPGHDSDSPLDDPAWRSAWRRAADPAHGHGYRPVDPIGDPQLRRAIAEHLRLMRGLVVDPARIVVTAGSREGLALLLTALAGSGHELRVGVEDPGFPGLRRTLARRGVRTVPLPVDASGVVVPGQAADLPRIVLVTPNHQYPYGSVMPASRRTELLDWAATHGTLVVEDDYDSEFRYLGPPLPALYGLAAGTPVVHLGTFSAVLSRDVGTGYLLLPPELVEPVARVRADLGCPVAPTLQRAVAGYLADGGLRRRLQRSRRRLAAAHRLVTDVLGRIPGAVDQGRLLVVERPAARAAAILAACADHGVLVGDLADGWSGTPGSTGVVLAYGNADPGALAGALQIVADTVAEVDREAGRGWASGLPDTGDPRRYGGQNHPTEEGTMTVTADLDLDFVKAEPTDLWVSVLLPTLRRAPDTRAGSTQLANLLKEASTRLKERGVSTDRLAPASALVDDAGFWQRQGDGLALYISDHGMHTFRLPLEPSPSVTIGQVPRLRPVVPALRPEGTYYLLQLAQKQIRLFRVTPDSIDELDRGAIPTSVEEYDRGRDQQYTAPTPGGVMFGHGDSGEQDALRESFLREVARGVEERLGRCQPAMPLVLAATEKTAASFRQICAYPGMTDVIVHGSADGMTPTELLDRARPVLQEYATKETQRRSERIAELRAGNRLEEDPQGVLLAAEGARVEALLVGASTEGANGNGPEDDLVDRAIQATLRGGGRVLPMPASSPETLIGVLRY
ncbi:DNA-binding transcriptional regulator, MocR family, contains an aminotransferase domain [Raineyella antarctica]|uniref:DNA-binding transcriptional regulator, MocR family, contains an aminotransferase domain n=1 Tax=Raineyella antarctica TaxID=1577474 RepID=A0A1G6GYE7_9ACTN|nr:aminotransferase class I/II-fold pyridoxal phosphate-dependent enzyme [Raineyella antarctica]SDB86964.1 DNA-binding transcriptional regulator, MocR family, contains an aminotransferase domain [Raineyella antarctica]